MANQKLVALHNASPGVKRLLLPSMHCVIGYTAASSRPTAHSMKLSGPNAIQS